MVELSRVLIVVGIFTLFFGLVLAAETTEPESIEVVLDGNNTNQTPSFMIGDEIIFDLNINLTGPILTNTNLVGSVADFEVYRALVDVLDHQSIYYNVDTGARELINPTGQADFAFNDAGSQIIYVRVDSNTDTFSSLDLDVSGLGVPSPKMPYLDFGADGNIEWQFFGDLIGYASDFILSDTLNENDDGEIIITDDNSNYWCEKINLPYARDVQVHAKLEELDIGENITATIIQLSNPSCVTDCDGYGGQYVCDLEPEGAGAEYYGCDVNMGYAIEGEFLVCVYNNVEGSGSTQHAKLRIEGNNPNSAYTCNFAGDKYSCDSEGSDDFLVKVKMGEYTEVLNGQANFMAGLVNSYEAFIDVLNAEIEDCLELTNGKCAVPLEVGSLSEGVISLENLYMEYQTGSGLKSTDQFYMGMNSEIGRITEIGTIDLVALNGSEVLEMSTSGLLLFTPFVNESGEYELNFSLDPGPSTSLDIDIGGNVSGGFNESSVEGLIKEYITFLNLQQNSYGDVLSAFGLSEEVASALTNLNGYLTTFNSLNISNQTAIEEFNDGLDDELDTLVMGLPKVINVLSELEEVVIVEPSDVTLDMVATEDERENAYFIQEDFKINAIIKYVQVELFDGSMIEGTSVSKTISGLGSNYYVYEVIPTSIVLDPKNEVTFEGFTLYKEGVDAVYRKDVPSVSGLSYSYFVNRDISSGFNELKTILVPKGGIIPRGYETVPVCGDNKCAVLEVDGEKIYLEDAISCPEDCAKKANWSGILIIFFIGILIIIAVTVYFKFFKSGAGAKGQTRKAVQFASSNDEVELRKYVSKSLVSGISREKIMKTLLERGWKREQVEYAFKPKVSGK
ncbi:hypothetical protein HOF78_03685 [Candidatus Woesearchaeota archaeon]|nr:hypothetical protein [Candidatus Woesearchaeota archaeon]MBT6044634.1 hypothetical protein [Candidatus Woesearchaeota archaeon]